MNRIQRAAVYLLINVMAITMITSTLTSISVNAVTEDDGWVEGDDDSQGEISSQEELEDAYEGSEWEDDIGRNEFEEATDDDDDDDDGPNPYCDQVADNYHGDCHDRKDYYQGGPKNGLYPCNDGTDKADWRECKDATKKNNDNSGSDSNPAPTLSSSVPTIETTTPLINATAEEEAIENACSAIGNGDAKKYTPLTFTKEMWADACPWLPEYDQSYVIGFLQGCSQKLGITDDTDDTCLKFVQDTMRKTFH